LIGLDGVLRRSGLNLRRLRAQVGIPAVIDLRATPVGCAERWTSVFQPPSLLETNAVFDSRSSL